MVQQRTNLNLSRIPKPIAPSSHTHPRETGVHAHEVLPEQVCFRQEMQQYSATPAAGVCTYMSGMLLVHTGSRCLFTHVQ